MKKEMTQKEKKITGFCRCAECGRPERKAFAWYKLDTYAKNLAICEICFNKDTINPKQYENNQPTTKIQKRTYKPVL
uniref:Uncharacterized protein n=1 Tax=viral metagenome TaxID=1070528 RepID=A0A6H2A5T1_9ZZZZ